VTWAPRAAETVRETSPCWRVISGKSVMGEVVAEKARGGRQKEQLRRPARAMLGTPEYDLTVNQEGQTRVMEKAQVSDQAKP